MLGCTRRLKDKSQCKSLPDSAAFDAVLLITETKAAQPLPLRKPEGILEGRKGSLSALLRRMQKQIPWRRVSSDNECARIASRLSEGCNFTQLWCLNGQDIEIRLGSLEMQEACKILPSKLAVQKRSVKHLFYKVYLLVSHFIHQAIARRSSLATLVAFRGPP